MSKLIDLGFEETQPNFFEKRIGSIILFMDFRTGKRRSWAFDISKQKKVDHHIFDEYKKIKEIENE